MLCNDCGLEHDITQEEHDTFCEAKTCCLCMITYEQVIPVDDYGERVCWACREIDGLGSGAEHMNEQEDDEYGIT